MKRLLTALALVFAAAYSVGWAPQPIFIGVAVLMGLLCYWEYSGLVAAHSIPRPGLFGLLAGLVIMFFPEYILPGVSVLVICAFVAAMRSGNLRGVLPQVACAFLGAFYTFTPWRFAIDRRTDSVHLLFFALALNWVGDSAAYYVGRQFGKHKLAPLVSPGKSWEGAVASALAAVLFGVLYLGHFVPQIAWWQVSIIAFVANAAGQLGDLAESAMKRGANVKDSGNLLPGHGGMLDRVDSSLFAIPVVYVLHRLVAIHFN
jgi:phosphatidate cytidylyltransferase